MQLLWLCLKIHAADLDKVEKGGILFSFVFKGRRESDITAVANGEAVLAAGLWEKQSRWRWRMAAIISLCD